MIFGDRKIKYHLEVTKTSLNFTAMAVDSNGLTSVSLSMEFYIIR